MVCLADASASMADLYARLLILVTPEWFLWQKRLPPWKTFLEDVRFWHTLLVFWKTFRLDLKYKKEI